jgi:hypothetical protein
MAGKHVYFGVLVQALVDGINALAPTLTAATTAQTTALTNATTAQTNSLNANLSSMITNLQLVNASVSNNLASLNVQPGTANVYQAVPVATVSALGNGTDGGVKTLIGGIKFFCSGTVGLEMTLADSHTSAWGSVWISKDMGNTFSRLLPLTASAATVYSVNLPVSPGDAVSFYVGAKQSGCTITSSQGIKIKYGYKDIVNTGAYGTF